MSRSIAYILFPLLALFATACGSSSAAVSPTPPTITEPTFTGILNRNGAQTFAFGANTGSITATITSLSPDGAVIGLAMGTWNGTNATCQIVLANDNAVSSTVVIGSAQVTANYCVRTYDVGTVTDDNPASFEIVISHF